MRREATLQSGHSAVADTAFAVIRTMSSLGDMLSTANPVGSKDVEWRFRFMLMISLTNQSKLTNQHHKI